MENKDNIASELADIINNAVTNGNFDELSKRIGDTVDTALNSTVKAFSGGMDSVVNTLDKTISQGLEGVGNTLDRTISKGLEGVGKYFNGTASSMRQVAPVNRKAIKKIKNVPNLIAISFAAAIVLAAADIIAGGLIPAQLIGSIPLIGIGAQVVSSASGANRNIKERCKYYLDEVGKKGYLEIEKAAQKLHISEKKAGKDVRRLLQASAFPEGRMDEEGEYLFGTTELYETYAATMSERQRRIEEEKARENETAAQKAAREALNSIQDFIEGIRLSNDRLEAEEISKCLDATEMIVTKIFERIQERPELLPQARKFIHYYLPLTEKLVSAYEKFELQGVDAQNIEKSKTEIINTMNTINKAYFRLYESLYDDEVIDVNSDISVLCTMLAQEGLLDEEINSYKNRKDGKIQ